MTPLMVASRSGNLEAARLLLKAGADVDAAKVDSQWTSLHFAAHKGHPTVVKLLLQHGASRSAEHTGGKTALEEAVERHQQECVEMLNPSAISPWSDGEGVEVVENDDGEDDDVNDDEDEGLMGPRAIAAAAAEEAAEAAAEAAEEAAAVVAEAKASAEGVLGDPAASAEEKAAAMAAVAEAEANAVAAAAMVEAREDDDDEYDDEEHALSRVVVGGEDGVVDLWGDEEEDEEAEATNEVRLRAIAHAHQAEKATA